ncbi:MAG: zinc ABC transporter substrate-binding protein [Corynebacteriales bacterium]|nr:zinc ABC transporter substrate-binding protein [Mycobacteriales bacterium]
MSKRLLVLAAAAAMSTTALTGCNLGDDDERPSVVVGFYPIEFLTSRIGGDHLNITSLAAPGVEPHDLELKPRQAAKITDADLVVHLDGFQPAVDDAIKEHNPKAGYNIAESTTLKKGYVPEESHEEGEVHQDGEDTDPHVWLDPTRMQAMADGLLKKLEKIDPSHKSEFRDNTRALKTELGQLDTDYQDSLANCGSRTFVTSHNAFGYLAERYQLTQLAISGIDPENEPSPERMREITDLAQANNTTVIFTEELVSSKVADTIATQLGARVEVLNPLEPVEGKDDYLSAMRDNLSKLRGAMSC